MPQVITTLIGCLTVLGGISGAFGDSVKAASPNRVAGTWNLESLTLTFSNGTTIQPAGPSPYGRLFFSSNLLYITQFNRADFVNTTAPPPARLFQAGTADFNAAVVAGVVAASGNYTVDANGNFVNLTTTGASLPTAIGAQRGSDGTSFNVSADGQNMNETLVLSADQTYRYRWRRIN